MRAAAISANANQVASQVIEHMTKAGRDWEDDSLIDERSNENDFVPRTGIAFQLRLAGSDDWCTANVIKAIGDFASNEKRTALIAEVRRKQ